ncbi:DUF4160 domain-containing protein [Selenomonas sp. AB3002]|uniref:DUF4160 domain-containing protein n=1 Tax=Selenomonas sp. AB3002 TaxID=1392502 RepID=UPI001C834DE7
MSGLPKVCQLGKYTIFFWSRENGEPIHVHVCEGVPHAEATKIWMNGMVSWSTQTADITS